MKKMMVVVLGLALTCVGCGSGGYDVSLVAEKVTLSRSVGEAAMKAAIVAGAENRDWTVEKERPGCTTLRLDVRGKHFVVVDVDYGADWYAVKYVDSGNLDYDPSTGKIRGKYIQWVRNLKQDIRLAAMKTH